MLGCVTVTVSTDVDVDDGKAQEITTTTTTTQHNDEGGRRHREENSNFFKIYSHSHFNHQMVKRRLCCILRVECIFI